MDPITGADAGDGDGDVAAMDDDVDRLSALNDDLLLKILFAVDSSPEAVRTCCLLSERLRPLWKFMPELRLPFFPSPATSSSFADALDDHRVPLRRLQVEGHGGLLYSTALPSSVAAWLPAAARRVTGCFELRIHSAASLIPNAEAAAAAIVELPCFEHATSISICLRLLGRLAIAATGGVFSHLTDLSLVRVRLHHPSELGAAVSSARCPCLQRLTLRNTPGLQVLDVSSTSLLKMTLERLVDLRKLTVDAPELRELSVVQCFMYFFRIPSESIYIDASEIVSLEWNTSFSCETNMVVAQLLWLYPRVRTLGNLTLFVYGTHHNDSMLCANNRGLVKVLQGTEFLENLTLKLVYDGCSYLLEDTMMLPKVKTLHLIVPLTGHYIGADLYHILRACTGIRKLVVELPDIFEEPSPCFFGCNCEHQSNWRFEKLLLIGLEEIEIRHFGRSIRYFHFVERLFGWATTLIKATIIFNIQFTEGMAKNMCRIIEVFSRPEIHIKFRYHNNKNVVYALED